MNKDNEIAAALTLLGALLMLQSQNEDSILQQIKDAKTKIQD
jgi:DNA-binding IclR family transcriptional regulator